uniref:RanBP2-type domain-containing protein n=1 Tax=Chrysotila carterae TaxID=13221 RepID=A0A7S4B810_CHRCT|mmetsp:Transcript_42164/g.92428  ORF Transcript_42164/g.92428 Transcript_42164/m.92428 type:complete len:122 (+) Transcript_42164:201-566(+)
MLAEDDEGVAAVRARCLSVLADSHANAELRRTAERVLNKAAQTRLTAGAAQHWHCEGCTLRNPVPAPVCAACGQRARWMRTALGDATRARASTRRGGCAVRRAVRTRRARRPSGSRAPPRP